ncbi:hypothetical protein TNCV_2783291 [Trichonephila clavipes]|nr:hypothetical protein TNCV_2783291 [Trichonephila clavipes]
MWATNDFNDEKNRPVVMETYPKFQCDRAIYSTPDGELDTGGVGVGFRCTGLLSPGTNGVELNRDLTSLVNSSVDNLFHSSMADLRIFLGVTFSLIIHSSKSHKCCIVLSLGTRMAYGFGLGHVGTAMASQCVSFAWYLCAAERKNHHSPQVCRHMP